MYNTLTNEEKEIVKKESHGILIGESIKKKETKTLKLCFEYLQTYKLTFGNTVKNKINVKIDEILFELKQRGEVQ